MQAAQIFPINEAIGRMPIVAKPPGAKRAVAKPRFVEIHERAMGEAHDLKSKYRDLFETLLIVESEQIYHQFEVPSLYLYCVELLELSPSIANDFINVTRKALEIPQLADAVRDGHVTISKARKICSVLNGSNFKEWIELAKTCSTRTIEKAVAQANPRESVRESIKYVSADVLELKLAVSEEWQRLLIQTKDLLSQKHRRAISSEEALRILMSECVTKQDPVLKAERASRRNASRELDKSETQTHSQSEAQSRFVSRYRARDIEHQIVLRDRNQCVFVDRHGKRCESKRWLHKHHIIAFAKGGEHSLENIETLCSAHHKIRHIEPQLVT